MIIWLILSLNIQEMCFLRLFFQSNLDPICYNRVSVRYNQENSTLKWLTRTKPTM